MILCNTQPECRIEQIGVHFFACRKGLIGILENRLNLHSELPGITFLRIGIGMAIQYNIPSVRFVDTQNHPAQGGLSTSGFPDHRQDGRLIGVHCKGNFVYGHKLFSSQHAANPEDFCDIFQFQQFLSHF